MTEERQEIDAFGRRQFLKHSALLGAALAVGPFLGAGAEAQEANPIQNKGIEAMKQRKLGSMNVSELGAGCMSISANYGPAALKEQGVKTFERLLKAA